jgi:hypothetical protein
VDVMEDYQVSLPYETYETRGNTLAAHSTFHLQKAV